MCRPVPKGKTGDSKAADTKDRKPASTLAEFAQRLLTDHPAEAARAFVPLTELLNELLDAAAAAGVIRADLSHQRITGVILQAIMFNAFGTTISGLPATGDVTKAAEELWELLLQGIQPAA